MSLRKWVKSGAKILTGWIPLLGTTVEEGLGHLAEREEWKRKIAALLEPTETEWRPDASPAALLRADFGVVPFHGRRAELDDLEAWANDGPPVAVRLYTAPGGFGKTRLLQEHVRLWGKSAWGRAGFLREGKVLELRAEVLFEGEEKPLLVVLDYAESRGEEIEAVVKAVRLDGSSRPRVRIVLLARSEGDWWAALRTAKDGVGDFFQGPCVAGPFELAPLTDSLEAREESFRRAAAEFGKRLGKAVSVGMPELDDEDFERVLLIHAAALAAVEGEQVPSSGLLDWLLRREERGLDRVRVAHGLGAEFERAMRHGAALLTLAQGADSRSEVVEMLRRVPTLADEGRARLEQVAEALHVLYRGRRWCDGVEPDLVGEHLVRKELCEAPELVAAVFGEGVPEEGLESGLTVLNRLAQRDEEQGRKLLKRVLDGQLERLGPAGVRVAVANGDPIGQVLAEALETRGDVELARQIQPHLPYPTTALRETGAVAYKLLRQELLGRDVRNLDERDKLALARYTNELSLNLAALDRCEEALETLHQATDLFRDLARKRPDTIQPEIARSLSNLSVLLARLGRREEALTTSQKAVDLLRDLAQKHPESLRSVLAASLTNLASELKVLGLHEEALRPTQQALEIRRDLGRERPETFRPAVAASLQNLAGLLATLGRGEEALKASQEAAEIHRDCAHKHPDAFLPDLAMSLNNLSNRLAEVTRFQEALEASRESAHIQRRLARQRPVAFRPDLALCLHTLAIRLAETGQHEEALRVIREVIDLRRVLVYQRPDAFAPGLANSLSVLHDRFVSLSRHDEALRTAVEAIDILEPHFRRYPAAHAGLMALMLRDYEATAQATNTPIDEPRLKDLRQILATVQSPD